MISPKHPIALAAMFSTVMCCVSVQAQTRSFDLPAGEVAFAMDAYTRQSGVQLIYKSDDVRGVTTKGVKGLLTAEQALDQLLAGTPLKIRRDGPNAVAVFRPSTAESATAPETESAGLESITITAQKRPEAAQAVPIAVTTFSSANLAAQRISNLQDVSRLTPGLLVSAFSQVNPTIAIRGASNTFSQMGVSKPVAVAIDEVFVPRNSAASFELFDLDNIAVMKGPQGTLFGRNVTGGAVVITTRKPSYAKREAEAQLTFGSLGLAQLDARANLPVGESAALKVSTTMKKRKGYGTDRLTGKASDDIDSQNLRAQLRVGLGDLLEAVLSADYGHDRSGGRTLSSNTLGDDGDRRTSELGVEQGYGRTILGTSAKLDWTLTAGELTSITAYRTSKSSERYSGVGANYQFLTTGSQALTRDADDVGTFSQELRYASPRWGAGDFVVGLYYGDEDGKRQLASQSLTARTGVLSASNLAEQQVRARSASAFGDGTWRLAPTLDLAAGVRYTHDTKTASLTRTDFLRPTSSFAASGLRATWSEVTPRVSMNWRLSRDVMVFGGVTRGFTSGGFNTDATSAAVLSVPFNPETVTNVEVGVKSQWLENRLRFNTSVFRMKYRDKQEFVNNSLTGVLSIVNASAATIDGFDVEVAYRPVPWLGLNANYGKLDTVYDRFVVGTVNNSGNALSSSPRNKFSLAADLRFPLAGIGHLVAAASYAWLDHYNTGAANDPNLMIPSYALANLNLGLEGQDRAWRVTAWVKNLNDTAYILTRSTQVVRAEYLGEPRAYGLTAAMKF